MRGAFLSQAYVRNSYLGYASSQFKRLMEKGDWKRGTKHARHMLRLLSQGMYLWTTGELKLRVEDPQWYFDTAESIYANPTLAKQYLHRAEQVFDETRPVIPTQPDELRVQDWLLWVRRMY